LPTAACHCAGPRRPPPAALGAFPETAAAGQ
jgi:hypothetical protein